MSDADYGDIPKERRHLFPIGVCRSCKQTKPLDAGGFCRSCFEGRKIVRRDERLDKSVQVLRDDIEDSIGEYLERSEDRGHT